MTLKAKISGSLLLLLFLGQMFDASLYPHAHFVNGRVIVPVYAHTNDRKEQSDRPQPKPCPAQQVLILLMSSTVVADAQVSAGPVSETDYAEPFVSWCESFIRRFEVCCNNFRGPPSPAFSA